MASLDAYGNLDYGLPSFTPKRRSVTDPADPSYDPYADLQGADTTGGSGSALPGVLTKQMPGLKAQPLPTAQTGWTPGMSLQDAMSLAGRLGYNDPNHHSDPSYWQALYTKDPEYAFRRMMGEGAGGRDAATQGQWAGGDPNAEDFSKTGTTGTAGAGGTGLNDQLSSFLTQLLQQQAGYQSTAGQQRADLLSQIKGLIGTYSAPVSATDPIIKAQSDAYEGQTNRALDNFRQMAAERAHAEGTSSGAFDSQLGNAQMAAGRSVGDFTSSLMGTELNNRRQALSDMLGKGFGLLSEQDQNDLQSRISTIDSALSAIGLSNTNQVANRGLDLQGRGLDLQKLLGLTGLDVQKTLGLGQLQLGNKTADNQNTQFYDTLTNNMGQYSNNLSNILASLLLGVG